jgi:hypothetical protein
LKFRDRVRRVPGGTRIVEYFALDNLGELGGKYSEALSDEIDSLNSGSPQAGWVQSAEYESL